MCRKTGSGCGRAPRIAKRSTSPIGEARDVLGDDDLRRLAGDGGDGGGRRRPRTLRPGDQLVLRTDRGLLDAFGWNPAASGPVVDVSLAAQGLPLEAKAIERLCGVAVGGLIQTALGIADEEEGHPTRERGTEAAEENPERGQGPRRRQPAGIKWSGLTSPRR